MFGATGNEGTMKRRLLQLFFWVGLLCSISVALADTVYLKSGKVLRGEVIQEDGESITVRLPQGTVKLQRSQVDRIERESTQAYQLGMAREQLARGRHLIVIEELEKARRSNPNQPELNALLVRAYGEFGQRMQKARRLDQAAICFKRLRELQPDSALAAEGLQSLVNEGQRLSELLDHARQTAAAGDYAAAIREFETALQYSPDAADQASGEMAIYLAKYAQQLLRNERYGEAAAQLERAFSLDPALAGRLENLYAAAALNDILRRLQPGKADEVQADVARMVSFAPAHPAVLYVAGRLEEVRKDIRAAGGYYARALGQTVQRPNADRVTALRQQLEQSLGVTGEALRLRLDPVDETVYADAKAGDFEVLKRPSFTIHHYNAKLAQEVASNLDAYLQRIQALTGIEVNWTKVPVKVYIHRTQEEYVEATKQAAWTGGMSRFLYFPGQGARNLEFHSWQTSPRLLKSVLPHELMHLVMASYMKRHEDLPRALHEGFAVAMEPDFRHAFYLDFLKRRAAGQSYLPLAELLSMKDYPRDPEFFYAEGFGLVAYLLETAGVNATMDLILHSPGPGELESRLLKMTRTANLDQLEAAWWKWIEGAHSGLKALR
jgi:tetratricopeptide (TPR) repeat protein